MSKVHYRVTSMLVRYFVLFGRRQHLVVAYHVKRGRSLIP